MTKRKNAGFSLVEMVIVVAILAIMGGILVGTTGMIGNYQVEKYTGMLESFMKKARTDAMAKNNICGFCVYQREGKYYIESYNEEAGASGTVQYKTVEVKELGSSSGIEITVSKSDGSNQSALTDNTGDILNSYLRVKFVTGTGAVDDIKMDSDTESKMDYTRITVSKGERSQCIEINPVTGRISQN